jgi:hypothetical protein
MVRIKTRQEIKRRKVIFSLENADANEVFLIGDFNKWNPKSHPMKSDENGAWVRNVIIPPGEYEYKFIVDGQWKEDPQNEHLSLNCFGTYNNIINVTAKKIKELKMAEAKGLMKPVKLKNELAEFLGATELPRTEITKKLWDYVKANKLQTKTENGKPENAGKFIVADNSLLPIFKNTKSKSKSGKVTDLTNLKEGQTIHMMQMAAVVGANIE